MYKLIYKHQFVSGFDEDQIVGNLAQLLHLKPKVIRLVFLSGRPSVIKLLATAEEVQVWCDAFLEAGVHLDVVSMAQADTESIADQIELELELHSIDDDEDEETLPPLLVKKVIPHERAKPEPLISATQKIKIKQTQQKIAVEQKPEQKNNNDTEITPAKNADAQLAVPAVMEVVLHQEDISAKEKAPSIEDQSQQENKTQNTVDAVEQYERDDADDEPLEVDFHNSSFLWGMLVIALAIVITASILLWLQRPLWAPVTQSPTADTNLAALASADLFALAQVDVERLQQLPGILQPESGMHYFPEPLAGFWHDLEAGGIAISQQLDHAWVAVYRADNQHQPLWILDGDFDPQKWREWLKKHYSIEEETATQIVFSSVDQKTCQKKSPLMAVIDAGQIVIGAPERVAAFRGRKEANSPPEKDLADWQMLSAKQMLSVALFNPAQLGNSSTLTALNQLAIDSSAVKGIYFGIAPRLLPPALEFNATLVGTNPQIIETTYTTLNERLGNTKNTIAIDWPETQLIYDRLKLAQHEQQLHAHVLFDAQIQTQLHLWSSSLLAQLFAMPESALVDIQERIDERPRLFANVENATLPDFSFSKQMNPSVIAQTSAGPFGVGISSIETTAQGAQITVDVNAFNLPNLGNEIEAVQFRITDIVDHQDQSLLSSDTCDANGVRHTEPINDVYEGAFFEQEQVQYYLGIQGIKKILLPDNINITNIGAIKGEIEYALPTAVERITLQAPFAGQLINVQGLQVRFLGASSSRLYFQHTANEAKLLQVNPLNAEGKLLAINNTTRNKNVFGAGMTTSIDVQGNVAAVGLVIAKKIETQTYSFSLGRIQPPEKIFAQEKSAPEVVTAATLELLKKDAPPTDVSYPHQAPQQTSIAGPALIAVNQLQIQDRRLSMSADVYLRNQHPLARQLSAVRWAITEVEDSEGNVHSVDVQFPIALDYMGGNWLEGVFHADASRPWLRGQMELRGQELPVEGVVALWGKLVFAAAGEPIKIQVPFQFGMQWSGSSASLKLARWEAGRMFFDIQGNFSDLIAIAALDENNSVVSQAAELRINPTENINTYQLELPVKQKPANIEFSVARDQQSVDFSFEIRAMQ